MKLFKQLLSIPNYDGKFRSLLSNTATIKTQTTPTALTQAATAGVCNSTQPGGCMQRNVVDKLSGNIGNLISAGGTAFSAANNALLLRMNGTLNAVNSTVTTIKSITNATLATVTNAKHGLQAIQNFASTAWKATQADKIMAGVSMAMTIHNGMMLSNNLLSTVSEALNMSLNAVGIRDETDTPIDIGAAVRDKINSILTSLIGAEQYAALTTRIAKANRIYQTGINVLDTTYSLFDSARTVAELTAENTGKIGNALRESGAVYEDAYNEFLEEVSPQNASMRKLGKLRDSVDNVEEVFSTINQVASEVVEFRETASQLREEKATLAAEIDEAIATEIEAKEAEKTENTIDTDISDTAFDSGKEANGDN